MTIMLSFLLKVCFALKRKIVNAFYSLFCMGYLLYRGAVFENKKNIHFRGKCILQILKNSRIFIGDGFCCNSGVENAVDNMLCSKIVVLEHAELRIGKMSGISNIVIQCKKYIEIGNYVNIGAGCFIMDNNFHSIDWRERMNRGDGRLAKCAPVVIKDHAFIGARCIICTGVTIGEHSIIAAGSVVVKDVPDNEMWGGNPARFIRGVE